MAHEEEFIEVGEVAPAGPRPFAPGEMVACERCVRANPPTRMNCLYCGAPLPVTEQSARLRRPALKKLEEWEAGFNVILRTGARAVVSAEVLAEASALLRVEAGLLGECLGAGVELPLARAASREEADLIAGRLGSLGLAVEVLADEELLAGGGPRRVRALELKEDALVGVGSPGEEPRPRGWPEVLLLVVGRVVRKRVEVEERREKSGRDGQVVDARELTTDEAVLDIYFEGAGGGEGWRVSAEGFDYSCLGARKSLLARENFVTLVGLLRERAGRAALDEDYQRLRRLLSAAWPPAERDDTLGFRRERAGRYSTGAATVVSNEAQFTRYSRLRARLARRDSAR